MKFKILFIFFVSLSAWATTTTVSVLGYGSSAGFCTGDGMSMFCVQNLEQQAQWVAQRDAELQCRLRKGQLQTYSGSCFNHCSPPVVGGNQGIFVNCQSQCRFNCNIVE